MLEPWAGISERLRRNHQFKVRHHPKPLPFRLFRVRKLYYRLHLQCRLWRIPRGDFSLFKGKFWPRPITFRLDMCGAFEVCG